MHISFFTNAYYPVMSGVVRSVSSFRQALTRLGHNVFVFAQDAPDFEDQEPFIFRYPGVDIGLPNDVPASIPISNFIDRLFPALKVDVIHSHHPLLLGQAAAYKADKHRLPLVFTFHSQYREYSQYVPIGQDFVQGLIKNVIDNWLAGYMRQCTHIIVPSPSIRDQLARLYGVEEDVSVLPTGIDVDKYARADGRQMRLERGWQNKQVLISVGRLAPEKNWDGLLQAVQPVLAGHPERVLAIVGGGDDLSRLERLAQELGVAAQVEFTGEVSFDEVPRYLKAADLFCFASKSETQGLATLEAMAAGLPVAAIDAPGTRDVVEHGREGLLTENSSTALGQAIEAMLSNPAGMERYCQAAREKAQAYSIENMARCLVQVYEQAIEDRQAGKHVEVRRG